MRDSDNHMFPSKLRLEMLINENNDLDLRYGVDYDFSLPRPSYGYGLRYNTSVILTFKGYRSGIKERILYRRLSINHLKKTKDAPVIKLDRIAFNIGDVLCMLNRHYGISLELDELINETFLVNPDISYECRISDKSLAWNGGSLPFKIDNSVQQLSDVLTVTNLRGLYPPTHIL